MGFEMSRRNFLKSALIAGGAGVFGSNVYGLSECKRGLPMKYSFMSSYSDYIEKTVKYFNDKHGRNFDSDLERAKIIVESGSIEHRSGDTRDDAFRYDPAQIANKGDYALSVLANKKEHTELIGNFSFLEGKKHTPWNKKIGAWDYSNSNMNWKDSIRGGVGWLFHKAAKYGEKIFESGDVKSYVVKKGDNLWEIAKAKKTIPKVITRYTRLSNPKFVPRDIYPGDKLMFRSAEKKVVIVGWDSWKKAISEYNGGVDSNYLKKVFGVYKEIKDWRNS